MRQVTNDNPPPPTHTQGLRSDLGEAYLEKPGEIFGGTQRWPASNYPARTR